MAALHVTASCESFPFQIGKRRRYLHSSGSRVSIRWLRWLPHSCRGLTDDTPRRRSAIHPGVGRFF
ncbi:MAG: hypothetical protein IID45_08995 [Planctomycetes bacterium]|nr:hypothetical protein [Planctomycetota bacterium]